jgi:nitroimidazol reductase NimA-like FMN-containing flavoprotein (pyridoxamine 5'-phosphate oxidase superfamily)
MNETNDFDDWSPQGPVEELAEASCWVLLESSSVGRLGVSSYGQPQIFPVDFCARRPDILFRTAAGTKLRELSANSRVAFEVDHVERGDSWSIEINGVARVLDDPAEIAIADRAPLPNWVPTAPYVYVRITPSVIRGRRFIRTLFTPSSGV